jgi:hypothetical protein
MKLCLQDHKDDEDEEIVARPQPQNPESAMIVADSVLTGDQALGAGLRTSMS